MKRLEFILVIILCGMSSCSKDTARQVSHLQRTDWAQDVKQGLNDFLDDCSGMQDAYAVFDFDNTTSIFDIENQMKKYQLETMSFTLSPDSLAEVLATRLKGDKYLDWIADIKAAYSYLNDKYGPFTAKGIPESVQKAVHADPQWLEFATKMQAMSKKVRGWMSSGDSFNWCLFWFTGMTEKEVYDIAFASHKKYAAVETSSETWTSPAEIPSKVGQVSISWINGIQVTDNIRELWKCLDENGIKVWVCSASSLAPVIAAIDAFGLHNYCTGAVAMTMSLDENERYTTSYDYSSGYAAIATSDGWRKGNLTTKAQTTGPGKVTAILNAIAPLYHDATPLAGFMDATGDFNFCTEFSSLRAVVCFNRADRPITDGGGLISEVAMYEKETLKYDYAAAKKEGNTLYLLQGRNENGQRTFRASNTTIRYGSTEEQLFANSLNHIQLNSMISEHLSVADAINKNAELILSDYPGYHSR